MGPNFIYFGAQKWGNPVFHWTLRTIPRRYGYRPIPSEIDTAELLKLRETLVGMKNDVHLMDKWSVWNQFSGIKRFFLIKLVLHKVSERREQDTAWVSPAPHNNPSQVRLCKHQFVLKHSHRFSKFFFLLVDFDTVITGFLLIFTFILTCHLWLNWNWGRIGYFHVHFCDLQLGILLSLFLLEMDPLQFTLYFIFAHELQAGISWTKGSQSYKHVTQESGEYGGLMSIIDFVGILPEN